MAQQINCPAGVAANGKAETNAINIERLHHDLHQLAAELRGKISEVNANLLSKLDEVSGELDRLIGSLEE